MLGCNVAALAHLVRLKPRQFLHACRRALRASGAVASDELVAIPEVPLGKILGHRQPAIRMSVMAYQDGMLPSEHAMALLSILAAENPAEVLEIGTFMGHTTRQMAETLPAAIIHTVDLPEKFIAQGQPEQDLPKDDFHLINCRSVGREFKGHPAASRIRQHFGDTAQWDFREAGQPAVFFIDGSHTYEYCKNDSEKCLELGGGRGVFLWHDCDDYHPGIVTFLAEWRRQGRDIQRIAGASLAYWKGI